MNPAQGDTDTGNDELALLQTYRAIHGSGQDAHAAPKVAALAQVESSFAPQRQKVPQSLTYLFHKLMLRGSKMWTMIFVYVFAVTCWASFCLFVLLPIYTWLILRDDQQQQQQSGFKMWSTKKLLLFAFCTSQAFGLFVLAIFVVGIQGRLVFLHIPKNAGTIIEETGMRGGINWGVYDRLMAGINIDMPDGNTCSAWHTPINHFDQYRSGLFGWLFNPYTGGTTFCVARNPYLRMLSEYQYQSSPSVTWAAELESKGKTGLHHFPLCSVEGLNYFANSSLHTYMEGRKYINDCHSLRQSDYIFDPAGNQRCSNILRIENLEQEFNDLMAKHGYTLALNLESTNDLGACDNLTTKDFDNNTVALMQKVYAQDFKALGYDPKKL